MASGKLKAVNASKINTSSRNSPLDKNVKVGSQTIKFQSVAITKINKSFMFPCKENNSKLGASLALGVLCYA